MSHAVARNDERLPIYTTNKKATMLMRKDFARIAMAIAEPRRQGRTTRMITNAPQGATLLARDGQHLRFLMSAASKLGRPDLKLHVTPTGMSLAGHRGPFEADHFTIEGWLYEAEAEIQKQIAEGAALLRRAQAAEYELELAKARIKPSVATERMRTK